MDTTFHNKHSRQGLLTFSLAILLSSLAVSFLVAKPKINKKDYLQNGKQVSETGTRHSFLICGSKMTAIFNEDSEIIWSVPKGARDGKVLPNGNIFIAENKRVVEYKKGTQEIIWSYALDPKNKEIASAWRLENNHTVIVENGVAPRLLEIDADGKTVITFPVQPETNNIHLQSRMARKLNNGNYLVPHLLAFAVKEYSPEGDVVSTIKTDLDSIGGKEEENWPFTAIRSEDGSTLVNLTHGNKTVIFDAAGEPIWICTNEDVDGRYADPCGAHLLNNQNVVIGSYGQKDRSKPIVFEVTPDKKVVWEFFHPLIKAHEIHILTTNGVALDSYSK
ncbi:MAG: beta-propeller domain-containing protein [Akkermansiaceae bacterium]